MNLRQEQIKRSYRTGRENLLREFYIPCLSVSNKYDRAVGYFSSTILSSSAQGVSAFFRENGGKMRLIFGGEISADDLEAALNGHSQKAVCDLLNSQFSETLERMVSEIDRRRLELLSFLVAAGRLEIKFAYRRSGIFHDKFGIFRDEDGNAIAFHGSANETAPGFIHNYERFFTYSSWNEEGNSVVEELQDEFDALWNGTVADCLVLPLPEASRRTLLEVGKSSGAIILKPNEEEVIADADSFFGERADKTPAGPAIPAMYKGHPYGLRDHQRRALKAWQSAGRLGIVELCTGAGKTVAAAHAVVALAGAGRLFVVISAPYINLAEQWCDELRLFGIEAKRAWGTEGWRDSLPSEITSFQLGAVPFCCVVVVNATMKSDEFRAQLQRLDGEGFLFIADECHHLRNLAVQGLLPGNPRLRLGLSATPFHYLDETGNDALRKYFGDSCFQYGLSEALEDKILAPYRYFPQLVELSADEARRYSELSAKIAKFFASDFASENEALGHLLRQRAEVVATAEGKITALSSALGRVSPTPLTLAYCGIDAVDQESPRQIDQIIEMMSANRWRVARYTARESKQDRQRVMDAFNHGSVDAIVAMKCLDEGIDIPGCRVAYILASSRDPRQFVQRRGRVLRKSPGKEFADIYDFLVVPPADVDYSSADRALVTAEIGRALEFAQLAMNRVDAVAEIANLAIQFDLAHLV